MECDVVSGRMIYERYTPSGIYFLSWKEADRILKGPRDEEGNPEYEAHVDYWMPFLRDIGFHDAGWREAFGGEIYYYGGSHGCINMPPSGAEQLFYLIDESMPIVIYYSAGCELENHTSADKALRASWENGDDDGSGSGDDGDDGSDESYDDEGSDDGAYDDETYDESYDDGSYDDGSYDEAYDESYDEDY